MTVRETILLIAGTSEASALAARIAAERPEDRLIVSFAGRTAAPASTAGERRVGGFGGWQGLAAFLETEGVSRLVDATHPFASGISRNAAKAAEAAGVRRIALLRPPWTPVAGDLWQDAACLGAARDALPPGARAFLALGRQHLAPFAHRPDVSFAVRLFEPPVEPLPFPARIVLGRPEADAAHEAELFRRLGVTRLVCRNSGGAASYGKVEAARRLALPVVMIRRPPAPEAPLAEDVDAVMRWLSS